MPSTQGLLQAWAQKLLLYPKKAEGGVSVVTGMEAGTSLKEARAAQQDEGMTSTLGTWRA